MPIHSLVRGVPSTRIEVFPTALIEMTSLNQLFRRWMSEDLLYYVLLLPLTVPVAFVFGFFAWLGYGLLINN